MKREIYLDHAATTPVRSEVLEAMLPYFSENYGNPSSLYAVAERAKDAIEASRRIASGILNCRPDEIVFTSGGTESDNAAIKGVALAMKNYGNHIITTSIEHHAVLDSCHFLEQHFGFEVTYLPVNRYGLIQEGDLTRALNEKTILVSVMYANNEIGTIQPISLIGSIVSDFSKDIGRKIPFHTDAVQAAGYLNLDVEKLQVDLLSLSGHKIYGPKGVGILFKKQEVPFIPHNSGGGQERGLRSGTENVASIVGMGKALELSEREKDVETKRLQGLRDDAISKLLSTDLGIAVNGHPSKRLPNNINISIPSVEGDMLVLMLNKLGLYVSTGSACSSSAQEPSHVIEAIGTPRELAWEAIRITLGKDVSEKEIAKATDLIIETLDKI